VSQIVIVNKTQSDQRDIDEDMSWKEMEKLLRREAPSLRRETTGSFRQANLRQAQLGFGVHVPKIDSILHDVSSWPEYYKVYSGAQGFLVFSRVCAISL
jgi:hypothetical protein